MARLIPSEVAKVVLATVTGATTLWSHAATTAVPTLVFEKKANGEEVPKLAVGCAGNAWIPLSVYNVILGVIDGKLGAVEIPDSIRAAITPAPAEMLAAFSSKPA